MRHRYERVTIPSNLDVMLAGATITREPWTAQTVRQDLPDVRVKVDTVCFRDNPAWAKPTGRIMTGQVRGRLYEFATVSIYGYAYPQWQFSWESIANSLNSGKPLEGN